MFDSCVHSFRRWIWDPCLFSLSNRKPPLTKRREKFTNNTKFPTDNGNRFCIIFACRRWNQHNYMVNLKNHVSSLRLMTPTGASSHFIYIVQLWWGTINDGASNNETSKICYGLLWFYLQKNKSIFRSYVYPRKPSLLIKKLLLPVHCTLHLQHIIVQEDSRKSMHVCGKLALI